MPPTTAKATAPQRSSLEQLPNELIDRVFTLVPAVSDAMPLARTSSSFTGIWRQHLRSISSGTLEHTALIYDDARLLIEEQALTDETLRENGCRSSTITVVNQVQENARDMQVVCDIFHRERLPQLSSRRSF